MSKKKDEQFDVDELNLSIARDLNSREMPSEPPSEAADEQKVYVPHVDECPNCCYMKAISDTMITIIEWHRVGKEPRDLPREDEDVLLQVQEVERWFWVHLHENVWTEDMRTGDCADFSPIRETDRWAYPVVLPEVNDG